MKVTETTKKRAPLTARGVAVGAVYSQGSRVYWYMRTRDGAVCLNGPDTGRYLSEPEYHGHFSSPVVVATTADLQVEVSV